MTHIPTIPQLTVAERYGAAFLLARDGLGWEDIIVKLKLPRTPEVRAQIRKLVLKERPK